MTTIKGRNEKNVSLLTVLRLQNFGHPSTNCTASKRLDLPLPFRPTTQFISAEKGWISGCCLNDQKFESVMDLMCMVGRGEARTSLKYGGARVDIPRGRCDILPSSFRPDLRVGSALLYCCYSNETMEINGSGGVWAAMAGERGYGVSAMV